jgi:hypothetical protein
MFGTGWQEWSLHTKVKITIYSLQSIGQGWMHQSCVMMSYHITTNSDWSITAVNITG